MGDLTQSVSEDGPAPARPLDAGADRVIRHGSFPAELVSIVAVFTAD